VTDPQSFRNLGSTDEDSRWTPPSGRWRIGDVIDLEFFLHADGRESDEVLHQRDRALFLAIPASRRGPALARRDLVRCWLEARRKQTAPSDSGLVSGLPGTVFSETLKAARWIVLILGFLSGTGLALSLLHYQGVEPVNVSGFVALLIGMQILILALLGAAVLLGQRSRNRSLTASFWGSLLFQLGRRAARSAALRLPANLRESFQAVFGLLKSRRSVYGSLLFLPLFLLSQLFGLAFNLGSLAATLSKILTADLAFGWQTTLQAGPDAVHRLVQVMALPWSWLVPEGLGYPSLEQIEHSRIVLKEGIAHLATPDLVSWWPFLCLGLLCYGLLPRLALLGTGAFLQRLALARLDFSPVACDRLILRMQTPLLETSLPASAASDAPRPERENGNLSGQIPPEDAEVVALVDEALCGRTAGEPILAAGRAALGLEIRETLPLTGDLGQNREVLEQIRHWRWKNGNGCVCLVQEAWQPPILESLAFIRELRRVLPAKGKIYLLLVGKPGEATIFTPPSPTDRRVWERQMQSLGDPYLGVVSAGEEDRP
jgi:hypothetical protein